VGSTQEGPAGQEEDPQVHGKLESERRAMAPQDPMDEDEGDRDPEAGREAHREALAGRFTTT
jgi:hypothetical protein